MSDSYPHLRFTREEPVNEKRPGTGPRTRIPEDIPAHGRMIQQALSEARGIAAEQVGGFDDRKLFSFKVEKGFDPEGLGKISGEIEFVSQEEDTVVIGFATEAALAQFEARLSSLVRGEDVVNKQVLFALAGLGSWGPEDRKGWALKRCGFPDRAEVMLDVELWPLEDHFESRNELWRTFEGWMQQNGIVVVDRVRQPGITLYRVKCDLDRANLLLAHRDVRSLDLPPEYGLERSLVFQEVSNFPEPPAPPEDAPGVTVLDSGVLSGHPLLSKAIGDAQSYLAENGPADEHGHGTHVAGLALYGDFESNLRSKNFVPMLRVFSGRVLDANNENCTGLIERQIEEAVRYFNEYYGCKVFNISIGDSNKPYLGGRVKGLSFVIDFLSRDLGVLFVVSAGNHVIGEATPEGMQWRESYPGCLMASEWSIIEPAPALNALTVGAIARHVRTSNGERYPHDPAEMAIAAVDQPSPFTLRGPSVDGALKPELVAHGGNWAVDSRTGRLLDHDMALGVVSTCHGFTPPSSRPFAVLSGTSMAAPQVSHMAAMLLKEYPDADNNMLRALLCAHASIPLSCHGLFPHPRDPRKISKEIRSICGYGAVDASCMFRSIEAAVTLAATDSISNKKHHFYEIPIPEDFIVAGKCVREMSVGFSHTPPIRSTRVKYKATRMSFKVVAAPSLDHVTTMFNKATNDDDYAAIPELNGSVVGNTLRGKGTVQADTWRFFQIRSSSRIKKDKVFLVVTRNDFPWGESLCDDEEKYSFVVCLRDRLNLESRLYTQVRSQIQLRARGRARI